jgi:pyruvate formate lyase activating enzyme
MSRIPPLSAVVRRLPTGVPETEVAPIGRLHSVETGAAADGPGVRFVYFLTGCSFRCLYCHNPDTWRADAGREITLDEAVAEIRPYVGFLKRVGGVTLSGGDPLAQGAFAGALARRLHDELGLHVALDTQGALGGALGDDWFDPIDLVLLDIKHADPERHRMLTGRPLLPTLDFARRMVRLGVPMWIRHVLVPGLTDAADDLDRLAERIAELGPAVERIDVLPYHILGTHKWAELGRTYPLAETRVPTPSDVAAAVDRLRAHGLPAN